IALVGLSALALTSTRWSMRKLGKRWKKLHRIVYPALVVALLHMLWVVRSDAGQWSLYATLAAILLAARVPAVERALVGINARWRGDPLANK
ncbi:MAG TPA: sulfoxide reductase heme-binding subunit YedZ, partial [Pseudomonas sp.]|nr:sulfoxide reductase heme-binding subunit YedZ [Pseudomonas sp.]